MNKDKDFDELDTNNDGYLSMEEFRKGKKPSGIEKEKLTWFLRLITLGDRFDIRDFWDRLKKSVVWTPHTTALAPGHQDTAAL